MEKSMRELKSNLTNKKASKNATKEAKSDTKDGKPENEVFYGQRRGSDVYSRNERNQTKSRNRQQRHHSRSKSRVNYNLREQSSSEEDRYVEDSRSRRYHDKPRRSKSKSRYDNRRGSERHSKSEHSRSHGHRRGYNDNNEVRNVHYSKYLDNEYDDNDEVIENIKSNNDDFHDKMVEVIYQEGNPDIDPNVGIVDCACPKSVVGRPWMDAHSETIPNGTVIKREKENEQFKL